MQARCDLHLHSDASDGSMPPDQLAASLGHVHLAILTDHDTLAGSAAFAKVIDSELPPPDGVELSLRWDGGTFHLLVYGYALAQTELAARIDALAIARRNRNLELLDRANQHGLAITEEEVLAAAGTTDFEAKSVGRPHFARVLVDHGYAESIQDAFDRYLAKGRPLYSPKTLFGFDEIGPLCADLGLVPVVAHPLSLGLSLASLVTTLVGFRRLGLVGLECLYAGYTPDQRAELTQIAQDVGLLVTGGSDYHGTFKPGLEPLTGFGDLVVPAEVGDRLLESLNRP
ncbi:MAG: PHP domain-containing protein [Ferrimicrobium sp.]